MTLNNEMPKRFTQTTDDEIINKRLNFFNITIDQCKFVPKYYTCSNIWCRVTFVKSLNQHFATYLLVSIIFYCNNNQKKLIRLFIISTSVVRAKRAGVSLFNVIFVLKEKGEITLLLTVY